MTISLEFKKDVWLSKFSGFSGDFMGVYESMLRKVESKVEV